MSEKGSKIPRWLLPAGLGVLVVILVAIALARGPVSLDPETAEGAVQEYLVALSDERWDDAAAVIHEDALGDCTGDDIAMFGTVDFTAELGFEGDFFGGVGMRETFDDGAVNPPPGDTFVDVTIHHSTDGGFGSSWSEHVSFELLEEEGFWWITGDPWPYFVWNCR